MFIDPNKNGCWWWHKRDAVCVSHLGAPFDKNAQIENRKTREINMSKMAQPRLLHPT